MENKVTQFCGSFVDWPKIVGYNWYHGGQTNSAAEGSMSDAMISAIAAAGLDGKPYKLA
jgi:hypothetical protein